MFLVNLYMNNINIYLIFYLFIFHVYIGGAHSFCKTYVLESTSMGLERSFQLHSICTFLILFILIKFFLNNIKK